MENNLKNVRRETKKIRKKEGLSEQIINELETNIKNKNI
jgi:hypothetical protein